MIKIKNRFLQYRPELFQTQPNIFSDNNIEKLRLLAYLVDQVVTRVQSVMSIAIWGGAYI